VKCKAKVFFNAVKKFITYWSYDTMKKTTLLLILLVAFSTVLIAGCTQQLPAGTSAPGVTAPPTVMMNQQGVAWSVTVQPNTTTVVTTAPVDKTVVVVEKNTVILTTDKAVANLTNKTESAVANLTNKTESAVANLTDKAEQKIANLTEKVKSP
jgi:hypothetical protein